MTDIHRPAESPCIRNCCLDHENICVGCSRSLEEIKEWALVDDDRRRAILQNAKQRGATRQILDATSRNG
jgi:uncharacterized protein